MGWDGAAKFLPALFFPPFLERWRELFYGFLRELYGANFKVNFKIGGKAEFWREN